MVDKPVKNEDVNEGMINACVKQLIFSQAGKIC
jgi:hypothetical protein